MVQRVKNCKDLANSVTSKPKKFLLLFHYRGHSMYSPFQQASENARGTNRDWGWAQKHTEALAGTSGAPEQCQAGRQQLQHTQPAAPSHQGPSRDTQRPQPAGSVPPGLHHTVKHSHSGRSCLSRWEKCDLVNTGTRSEGMIFTV